MDLIIPGLSKCKEFLSKDTIKKIKRNIQGNNSSDVNKFARVGSLTYNEVMEKINGQGNKCYICLQEFKYDGGNLCYFFPSADRINNDYPHDKENIAISCLYCNIRSYKEDKFNMKSHKSCKSCLRLDHNYPLTIISKDELFCSLEYNTYRIKKYIDSVNELKGIDDCLIIDD